LGLDSDMILNVTDLQSTSASLCHTLPVSCL
jgi:hypothetical protein